jgi:hypothetical protein
LNRIRIKFETTAIDSILGINPAGAAAPLDIGKKGCGFNYLSPAHGREKAVSG